ncbi:uncharacterized protein RCC_06274 [Ramularia collo-cygni]|uniref:Uncharacterized protein n=1 Tax=Ramularia collo-cygni TaxID=112498 RepID=A0A2D3VCF9_9PEZI|nr:uncharacterized protein RCC_06274 [Ramularia collo-cygni]CZT20414.1 uncharacterized protein RCC_06274 [Ramularia collo-cygni]
MHRTVNLDRAAREYPLSNPATDFESSPRVTTNGVAGLTAMSSPSAKSRSSACTSWSSLDRWGRTLCYAARRESVERQVTRIDNEVDTRIGDDQSPLNLTYGAAVLAS